MQDVQVLEGGGAAAGALDLGPGPVAALLDVLPGRLLGPHVHQGLQQAVVIERVVSRGTAARAESCVKLLRLINKPEPLDVAKLHWHSLSAIKSQSQVKILFEQDRLTF